MKYLIVFILLLVPAAVFAQDEIETNPYTQLYTLPMPAIQEIGGDKLLCTTAKEWQKVMLIANDYRGLFMWRLEIQGALAAHDEIVQAYELKITSYEASIKLLKEDRTYYKTRVGELESALLAGGKSHKVEKMLMWGVILVETVAIGALGVASFVQAN